MIKKLISLSVISLLICKISFASDSGVYVGINMGVASVSKILDINSISQAGSPVTTSKNLGAFGLISGYQFNKNIALEFNYLGLSDYYSTTALQGLTGSLNGSATARSSFLTANIKGMIPLNDKFSLFGKLGAGYNFVSVNGSGTLYNWTNLTSSPISLNGDSNNFTMLFGVGASYNITPSFSLSLSDNYYVTSAPTLNPISSSLDNFGFGNTNYLNIGAQYLF